MGPVKYIQALKRPTSKCIPAHWHTLSSNTVTQWLERNLIYAKLIKREPSYDFDDLGSPTSSDGTITESILEDHTNFSIPSEYILSEPALFRVEANPEYKIDTSDPSWSSDNYIMKRKQAINYLCDLHTTSKGSGLTLFLAIHIMDRFMLKKSVSFARVSLMADALYLVAAKYTGDWLTECTDWFRQKKMTKDVRSFEFLILRTVSFMLNDVTPMHFCYQWLSDTASLEAMFMFLIKCVFYSPVYYYKYNSSLFAYCAISVCLSDATLEKKGHLFKNPGETIMCFASIHTIKLVK